jgi:hypothetical protein
MKRKILLPLIVLATPLLGGCAVQAALLAADLADEVRPALGPSNAHLRPVATQQCTARAAQYGSVYITDVEQRRSDRIIVWGSVTDARQHRRTFECHYTTSLTRFEVREIARGS